MPVKFIIVIGLLLGAVAPAAFAQAQDPEGPTTRDLIAERLDGYRDALELDDYHWSRVETILRSAIRERIAIGRRYGLEDEAALAALERSERRQLERDLEQARDFTLDRMERYLDEEQFERFEDYEDGIYEAIEARIEGAAD
jgi:hypothetical protein